MEYKKFLERLEKELVVTLGCTEPMAIAFAAALAKKHVKGEIITSVRVLASANVLKNAMAVAIPGAQGCGVDLAAALGVIAGDFAKGLEVLEGLTPRDVENAKTMIEQGKVMVGIADTSKKLYVEVIVKTPQSYARVVVADEHTQVVLVEVDGNLLINRLSADESGASETGDSGRSEDSFITIDSIWEFVQRAQISDLTIIKKAIELNTSVGLEGLLNAYGLEVGKTIKNSVGKGMLSDDLITHAMALTAGASDARMSGCTMPVMSNSGSGNQGISATLPVVAAGEKLQVSREQLIRAVTLSNLIAIYIKLKIGRLSALCGATASGTGASCGIAYLLGGGKAEIRSAIQNMQGNTTGMFCDGAKAGCALKLSTCTSAAVQSAIMAVEGKTIQATDGIIESTAEQTIENLGRLANDASYEVDRVILDIMVQKKVG
ncbi:L-cysteine desulfidase family protein [Desulfosporosinus shakirovi]|uniref:L-cysteine desulfidase family protein n=1 Tax=Desulfosporosinus shakirovi TaxID=2885154 RepID=UPI001E3C28AD|nr:L-serine ammonia-lyase, iron-sulfur-dependent, subunit alpha [Desulfosporosinus sp. SRJS8]MCB8814280.1 L-serine ammonia-lyase, iron-sulfur-dependent, subunit alpha [Desulfosporosinus sp. SRJS8]